MKRLLFILVVILLFCITQQAMAGCVSPPGYPQYTYDEECAENTMVSSGPCNILGEGNNVHGECFHEYCSCIPNITADFYGDPLNGTAPLFVFFYSTSTPEEYIQTYYWDFGDGSHYQSNEPGTIHLYQTDGVYTVRLYVQTYFETGDWENKTGYIIVGTIPVNPTPPIAGFSAQPISGDAPLDVKFIDQSKGAESWYWDFGDGYYTEYDNDDSPFFAGGPWHTYQNPGIYTVTQTVYNEYGNDMLTKTNYIYVGYQSTGGIRAAFSATPLSGGKPLDVTFTDLSTGDITDWMWDFGDGYYTKYDNDDSPFFAGGPSHTYREAGNYTVKLHVWNQTDEDWETKINYILVFDQGKPYADWFASPDSGPAPLDVKFWDTSSGSPTLWYWDFGDGYYTEYDNDDSPFFAGGPAHIYRNPGQYLVTLTVSNQFGSDAKAGYITVTNPANGTLTINVLDSATRALIHNAHVKIDGNGATIYDQDVDGSVSVSLALGTYYSITVSAPGYYDQNFQFTLTESTTMNVALVKQGTAPPGYSSIDFSVRDANSGQSLYGATVKLGTYATITDVNGMAHFTVSNSSGTLQWVVSKNGYFSEQGTADTSYSQQINVPLRPSVTQTPTPAISLTPTHTPTHTPTSSIFPTPTSGGGGDTEGNTTITEDEREAARKALKQAFGIIPNIFGIVLLILFIAIVKRGMK